MSDIAEKLRERPWRHGGETDQQAKERRQKEREEGAAEIGRLTARVEELEGALEKALLWTDEENDVGEWRSIARAAITQETE